MTVSDALSDRDERMRSLASVRRARERERRAARGGGGLETQKIIRDVIIPETIVVQELANRMAERGVDVIRTLMKLGVMANVNQTIDGDTAELVTTEFGHRVRRVSESDIEFGLKAEDDEGVLYTLAQMEKLKSKLGLAELQMRADEELRDVEELVTDEGVHAETILVDRLVDPTKAKEIARGLKEVAGKQLDKGSGEGVDVTDAQPGPDGEQSEDGGPRKKGAGTEAEVKTEESFAVKAISDQAIRERILNVARSADRSSEDYSVVYRNYRRSFLAELFRSELGSGRKEYLERYFHTIRPE